VTTFLLEPSDVLFFKDARPMSGSFSGYGAAWPMPHVLDAAWHAGLHRAFPAELPGEHVHRIIRNGNPQERKRRFGALVSAGPFPVDPAGNWWFPKPADAHAKDSFQPTHFPSSCISSLSSSLPKPMLYGIGSSLLPSKEGPANWWDRAAWETYLRDYPGGAACTDSHFSDKEFQVGITIDPQTGTTGTGSAKGQIYSCHYLRLKPNWKLGALASAEDNKSKRDLLAEAFPESEKIVVGGQQKVCTVRVLREPTLRLPLGLSREFNQANGKFLVKWILLSPAIWPEIAPLAHSGRQLTPHPGGWLPSWVDARTGKVLLRDGPGESKSKRLVHLSSQPGGEIQAQLVAAMVQKPLLVSGWSVIDKQTASLGGGGAKSTHLAVPAGAIYYFQADSADAAEALARNLNWDGTSAGKEIQKRRSALLGEKGFGLGVCGTWRFFENVHGRTLA
jgi:hypothetical protein